LKKETNEETKDYMERNVVNL